MIHKRTPLSQIECHMKKIMTKESNISQIASRDMNLSLKRAAIAQLCSTASKHHNLLNIAKCARIASEKGASMLFLPECFGFIGSSSQETLDNAEEINNEIISKDADYLKQTRNGENLNKGWLKDIENFVEHGVDPRAGAVGNKSSTLDMLLENSQLSILEGLKAIAVKSGLWISAGGLHEEGAPPSPDDELCRPRVYNTHFIMDSHGQIVAKYRKIHLFDVSIPSQGIELRESATTAPGSNLVVCDSPIGKLGLSTCYDLRFPEMYAALVQEGGADVLLVPSAFTVPTGKAHWHTLLRARAIENQCYVLASAQFGQHNEKRMSYGHSIAIDPWGDIVADAGGCDGEGDSNCRMDDSSDANSNLTMTPTVVFCDIDDDKMKSTRERMPIQLHRTSSSFSW